MASSTSTTTSALGIAGPLANLDDQILKGVRRSRFSLHLKTHKVRRWLLVQLVSVPVEEIEDQEAARLARRAQVQRRQPETLQNLVEQYRVTQPIRSWAR